MRYPEPSAEAKEQVHPTFPDFGAEVPGADHAFFSRSRRNYDQQAYQTEPQYCQTFFAAPAHSHGGDLRGTVAPQRSSRG